MSMVSARGGRGGNTKWSCVFKEDGGPDVTSLRLPVSRLTTTGSALVFHFAALFVIWIISPPERFLEPMLDERREILDSGDGDFVGGIFFFWRGDWRFFIR